MFTMLLIGLGLDCLSLPPIAIPEIKNVCRRVSYDRCQSVAQKALTLDTAVEVNDYLKQELASVLPTAVETSSSP